MNAEKFTKNYVIQMKSIQEALLDFLESENEQCDPNKIINLFSEQNIRSNKQLLKSFLYLLLKITKNYHHSPGFYTKIDQILTSIKNDIKTIFTNSEIFRIFKSQKRVLLYLLENKILIPDESIAHAISEPKYYKQFYPQFFYPEFESLFTEEVLQKMKNQNPDIFEMEIESFKEKRRIGENDSFICQLIRDDSVVEFIKFINQNSVKLSNVILPSIFETNSTLLKNLNTTLIEYSVFFGSIQIFQYLKMNNAELSQNIQNYAIHGKKAELIHILEENNNINDNDEIKNKFVCLYFESIKCHHIDNIVMQIIILNIK